MRAAPIKLTVLLALLLPLTALAAPDRASLVEAWEVHIASLPGTQEFEAAGDGLYRIKDTDLPYEGELRVIGALLRPVEYSGFESGFSQFGMVEFELTDLPAERRNSQSYFYWIADRQTLHFSDELQSWVSPQDYQEALTTLYEPDVSLGPLSFMLNYGIWVFLIALIVFVLIAIKKQSTKARALIDDSADINRLARENLQRAEGLQNEVLEISRGSQELHRETNRLLGEILARLQK